MYLALARLCTKRRHYVSHIKNIPRFVMKNHLEHIKFKVEYIFQNFLKTKNILPARTHVLFNLLKKSTDPQKS